MADRRVSVTVDANPSPFVRGMHTASAATKRFTTQLDAADGRLANLVQTGLALAPALVPIGAQLVPALAGIAAQGGAAVGAIGAIALAVNGVGDALGAVNDFKLDPSRANFDKMRESMGQLSREGREFVLFLDSLDPEIQQLQDAAAAGFLPGLAEGMNQAISLQPKYVSVIDEISSTLGDLSTDAGEALSSDRFEEFLDYIEREARPTLTAMAQTGSNLAAGFGEMMMAFDPLADDFSSGMVRMSESFDNWASGLDESESFAEFVDYIRDNGPKVLDTLGALGGALVGFVKAAAPVGSAALPVLEALGETLEAIADSPAGPILVSVAAGIGAIGRSMAVLGALGLRGGGQGGFIASAIGADKLRASIPTMRDVGTSMAFMGQSSARASAETLKARESVRGFARAAGPGAAGVGALVVATTGLADGMGLTNTATLGLAGSMAGPLGAAIGSTIGLTLDAAAANDDMEASLERLKLTLESGAGYEQAREQFNRTVADYRKFKADVDGGFWDGMFNPKNAFDIGSHKNLIEGIFGESDVEETYEVLKKARREVALLADGYSPAVEGAEAFGHTVGDSSPRLQSVEERVSGVRDALSMLKGEMTDTEQEAATLADSLDELFGGALDQAEATDRYQRSLLDLRDQLKDTNAQIKGQGRAALDNRDAMRSSVDALLDKVKADADAGASGKRLVRTLADGRQAILDQAVAAGASKGEVREYLNELNMTPKQMATLITTPGLLGAKQQVRALTELYDLTPKQVRTLMRAIDDGAISNLDNVTSKADLLGRMTPTPVLRVSDQASAGINTVQYAMQRLDGTTATVTTYQRTIFQTLGSATPRQADLAASRASGGPIPGWSPHKRADNVLIAATADEHMWTVDETAAVGGHAAMMRLRAAALRGELRGYATGGPIQGLARGGQVDRLTNRDLRQFDLSRRNDAAAELRELKRAARDAGIELDDTFARLARTARKLDGRLDKASDRLSGLRDARRDLSTAAAGSFDNDPFGNGLSGALLQLRADRNDSIRFRKALQGAADLGLKGGAFSALASSGDLLTASQITSRRDARQLQRAFFSANRAQSQLGRFAGGERFDAAISKQDRRVDRLANAVERLESRIERSVARGAESGARSGIEGNRRNKAQRRSSKR